MQERPPGARAFVAHVVTLVAGPVCLAAALVEASRWGLAMAGGLLVASGISAIVARRSAMMPPGVRHALEHRQGDHRRDATRANSLMMGSVLILVGLVIAGATLLSRS